QSLRGTEGPRPLGTTRTVAMHTFGPLVSGGLDCYRDTPHKECAARDAVWLKMSNRVAQKEWRTHVSIDSGAKIAWDSYGTTSDTQLQQTMSLPARLLAGHAYNITIKAGMKDEYGQKLAKDVVIPFTTDDEWPEVEVGLTGSIFEAGTKKKEIPIGSVNVPSYSFATAVPDEAELARFLARDGDRKDDPIVLVTKLPHGKKETVSPKAAKNDQSVKKLAPADVLAPSGGHGAMVLAVQQFSHYGGPRADVHIVDVTDLAISAKMSRFGSVVWVTRLSDGKPVGGAHVGIRAKDGAEIFATATNADGVATIPADKYVPLSEDKSPDPGSIVVARVGDDWTYRKVGELVDSWRFGASIDAAGDLLPFGMLFTDRGVYRPGETVRVKGIFREPLPRGTATPAGSVVSFSAFDPGGASILEKQATLGPFGDFSVDVPIPAGIKLGSLGLHAEVPAKAQPKDHGTASASVEIAEYKPAEFKVSVDPEKPAFVRGDKASFTTRGDYLFGAPMSGGKVHYTITRGYSSFVPPGAEGMIVDDESFSRDQSSRSERGSEFQSGDGDLSAKGDWATTIPLPMPHQSGPETVTFESEVQDISRQSIAGRASALVHPGDFYVALQPPKDMFVAKGAPVTAAIAAIEPSGKKRAGVPVTVDLVRRSWETVVESHGDAGGSYQSKITDKVVGTCSVTSTAALASCALTPSQPGYYILHAHGKDARG
ncbi:MAG TPA: MG2 domain-containing protein, partial [Polyangiaceae bacterium]